MSHVLFRAGSALYVGTPGAPGVVNVKYRYTEKLLKVMPESVAVDPSLIINSDFQVTKVSEYVDLHSSLSRSLREDALRLLNEGIVPTLLECQDTGVATLNSNGSTTWTPLRKVLSTNLARSLALESLKDSMRYMGLVPMDWKGPVTEASVTLSSPLMVYMKSNPFRDISKIGEGTTVSVLDYDRGCLVLEADGEEFWHPIEESFYLQPHYKDDEYYFNMDADHDKIPDPLEYLPSKPGLGSEPPDPDHNYNKQPDLPSVAGNFHSMPELSNDESELGVEPAGPDKDPMVALMNKILGGADLNKLFKSDPSDGTIKMFRTREFQKYFSLDD
jgi:hypothetical protein